MWRVAAWTGSRKEATAADESAARPTPLPTEERNWRRSNSSRCDLKKFLIKVPANEPQLNPLVLSELLGNALGEALHLIWRRPDVLAADCGEHQEGSLLPCKNRYVCVAYRHLRLVSDSRDHPPFAVLRGRFVSILHRLLCGK